MGSFSVKWFAVYYPLLGIVLLITGGYLALNPDSFRAYLKRQAQNERPPLLLRTILKYLLLFSIPCLLLSFFPFSWPEFLFSVWCLMMVYMAGSQLLRWPDLRELIESRPERLRLPIRWMGAILVSAALIIFMLEYLLIRRAQLF
ncbi:MAG: hypothetical protein R3224_00825 [Balneolaceae bacterium]|nr:hypothetical protein [Balneolaceae bacterium]